MNNDCTIGDEKTDICSICLERIVNVNILSYFSLKSILVSINFALSVSESGLRYYLCLFLRKRLAVLSAVKYLKRSSPKERFFKSNLLFN